MTFSKPFFVENTGHQQFANLWLSDTIFLSGGGGRKVEESTPNSLGLYKIDETESSNLTCKCIARGDLGTDVCLELHTLLPAFEADGEIHSLAFVVTPFNLQVANITIPIAKKNKKKAVEEPSVFIQTVYSVPESKRFKSCVPLSIDSRGICAIAASVDGLFGISIGLSDEPPIVVKGSINLKPGEFIRELKVVPLAASGISFVSAVIVKGKGGRLRRMELGWCLTAPMKELKELHSKKHDAKKEKDEKKGESEGDDDDILDDEEDDVLGFLDEENDDGKCITNIQMRPFPLKFSPRTIDWRPFKNNHSAMVCVTGSDGRMLNLVIELEFHGENFGFNISLHSARKTLCPRPVSACVTQRGVPYLCSCGSGGDVYACDLSAVPAGLKGGERFKLSNVGREALASGMSINPSCKYVAYSAINGDCGVFTISKRGNTAIDIAKTLLFILVVVLAHVFAHIVGSVNDSPIIPASEWFDLE
ncbi:hypothetical protein ADUPG1_000185 [Aduncisulcus paluster]|uniref:Uncharacterized protein n=1 Tax=Aduncisulcus paluster TaxID=2918883 RepID=A0ABQ5K768_9EUKA|nr:hypothetical protein ADUPG1_000185 [Aduncisulcus paluster]